MYRRQEGELVECVLIKIYCEYRCGNCLGFCFDIISTHRCWWGCKLFGRDIWRYPSRAQIRNRRFLFRSVGHRKDSSLFFTSQRMPSRYNALTNVCNFKIFRREMYLRWYFWFDILWAQRFQFLTIYTRCYLRGYFDEKRLD